MINVVKIADDEYEFQGQYTDYHIRLEGYVWFVDMFDSGEADNDDAHVDTEPFDSLAECLNFIETAEALDTLG